MVEFKLIMMNLKNKKNNNNNIKTRSLFRTFQLTFFSKSMKFTSNKAQRKNLIGKIYLVKEVQELNSLLFRIHPLAFGHHIIFSRLQLIIAHVFSRFFNGSHIFGIFITFVRFATIQLVPLRYKSKYDC